MTKTLIDIDDDLMRAALDARQGATKKAVVTEALRQFVRRSAQEEYLRFVNAGGLADLDDDSIVAAAQR